jgi:hypothetical protein
MLNDLLAIETPTKAQADRWAKYQEEWLKIGLSTEPADRPAAELAVSEAYQEAGFDPPKTFIWLGSPIAGAYGSALLANFASDMFGKRLSGLKMSFCGRWYRVDDPAHTNLLYRINDQVSVFARDLSFVHARVNSVYNMVQDRMRDDFNIGRPGFEDHKAIVNKLPGKDGIVCGKMNDTILAGVRAELLEKFGVRTPDQFSEEMWMRNHCSTMAHGGSYEAGHSCFYSFLLEEFANRIVGNLNGVVKLAKFTGAWWAFRNAAILTERPCRIDTDLHHEPHSLTGQAISYPDGWGVHALHGIRVSQDVIEQPEKVTIAQIRSEKSYLLQLALMYAYESVHGFDSYRRDR